MKIWYKLYAIGGHTSLFPIISNNNTANSWTYDFAITDLSKILNLN
jgi:hypothetical protein